jgi:hypothetical protein
LQEELIADSAEKAFDFSLSRRHLGPGYDAANSRRVRR